MKARVIKSAPEAIIAYKQRENAAKLRKAAAALRTEIIFLEDDKAGEKVGFLAGYGGFSSNGSREEAEEGCVIFAGLESRKIDKALSAFREAGVKVPYKAVVTAANQSWSLKQLISELMKEREKLGG